jgi:hypothetical protein
MAQGGVGLGQIVLNDKQYKILGKVVKRLRPGWSQAIRTTGEQLSTDMVTPSWIIQDVSGGFGIQRMNWNNPAHRNRFWDSYVETRFPGQITPSALIRRSKNPEEEAVADQCLIKDMLEYKGLLYGYAQYYDDSATNYDAAVWVFDPDALVDSGINTNEALDGTELGIDCSADASTAIPRSSIIKIDNEKMFVNTTGTTLTVGPRGFDGTTADAHSTNADIYIVGQWAKKADILAAQTGVQLSKLCVHGTYLYAGGVFSVAGPTYSWNVYNTTDGTTWNATAANLAPTIPAAAVLDQVNHMLSFGTKLVITAWDDSLGLIYVVTTVDNGANWVLRASIPSAGPSTGIAKWVDQTGAAAVWVGTREGGYIVNTAATNDFTMWVDMHYATSQYNGIMAVWDAKLFITEDAGCRMCSWDNGALNAPRMGPNLDDGLPTARQGHFLALAPVSGWLFAAYGATSGQTDSVLTYDIKGWHSVFYNTNVDQNPEATIVIQCIAVSSQDDGVNRLHVSKAASATQSTMYYQNNILDNPVTVSGFQWPIAQGYISLTIPQFDADVSPMNAGWYMALLDADGLGDTTNQYIALFYALDGASSFTQPTDGSGFFTSTNADVYFGTTNQGLQAKRFQPQLYFYSSQGTGLTAPKFKSLSISYQKIPDAKYDYYFVVDIDGSTQGTQRPRDTVISDLETALTSRTKVTFNYSGLSTSTLVRGDGTMSEELDLPPSLAILKPDMAEGAVAVKVSELV